VSVLTNRAPGMRLELVPMVAWSALVGAVSIVLTMPVLFGNLVYLFVDHRNGKVAFGGASGIGEWAGWAFTQPATFVWSSLRWASPPTWCSPLRGRPAMRGGMLIGIGLVGVAALAAITQVQHTLTWPGDNFFDEFGDKLADLLPYLFFNGLPVLGVLMVLAVAGRSLGSGRPSITGAFVFAFLGLGMVLTGMAATSCTWWTTPACRAPCSRRPTSSTSPTAPCSPRWAAWPTGVPSCGVVACPKLPCCCWPASVSSPRCWPRCRTSSLASPTSRPASWADSPTAAPRSCGTCSSPWATV
jgi:hypothetical protein